jgi:hypothetical protein
MTIDEEIDKCIYEIKSIVEEYLTRISDAIQQPKTFDELINGLNSLIGRSSMTRNLQRSTGFFYTFFMYPRLRGNEASFLIPENTRDRLRELELGLVDKISFKFSIQQIENFPSRIKLREELLQKLEDLQELGEDLEAQSQGFTDRTKRYPAKYAVDFIILSAYSIRKTIKGVETDYRYLAGLPEHKAMNNRSHIAVDDKVIKEQESR